MTGLALGRKGRTADDAGDAVSLSRGALVRQVGADENPVERIRRLNDAGSGSPSAACGGQASSVPLFLLFPHESLRWIRVGALAPLQTPLKRPRRGLRPPLLDLPRGLVCAGFIFGFTKRTKDAPLIDRRGYRNTLRLFRMHSVWQILR